MNKIIARTIYILLPVLLLSVLLLGIALGRRSRIKANVLHQTPLINPAKITLIEVKSQRFEDTLQFKAQVRPNNQIRLRFETAGVIEFMDFKVGDMIRKGNVIARLNSRDQYLRMKKARIEMEQIEKFPSYSGSPKHIEELKEQIDRSTLEFEKTVLRCPWDGVLMGKYAAVGETVTPKEPIGELGDIEKVWVRFGVHLTEIDRLIPGQKAVFTLDTGPNIEFTGKVAGVIPSGDKTLPVEALFSNEGALLRPWKFGVLRVIIYEKADSLFVPNEAVKRTSTGNQVVVANKENKAEFRNVEIIHRSSENTVISKGLQSGDLVVSPFPEGLRPWDLVPVTAKK
jgi:multidrug efflux pump subunit AcrA (membrane-fusion protein)